MFKSKRKANAERSALAVALIFALLGILVFLVGLALSLPVLNFVALALFVVAGLAVVGVAGTCIGAEREETVARYQKLLGDPYHVIHDVLLRSKFH